MRKSNYVAEPRFHWLGDRECLVVYRGKPYKMFQEDHTWDWLLLGPDTNERFTSGGYPAAFTWLQENR